MRCHCDYSRPEGLRGGILYHDGQFNDARLAIALMRTLIDLSGVALNYAPVVGLINKDRRNSCIAYRFCQALPWRI